MLFRIAEPKDISQIQVVRHAVKENRLSNPALVSDKDVEEYITKRGKGWVCEINDRIVGFAIANLQDNNIWALFIDPSYEGLGIGKRLHEEMLNWYFMQNKESVWLSTAPGTRAEKFYSKAGWKKTGIYGKGEIKFELTASEWMSRE